MDFSWDLKINGQSVSVPYGGFAFSHTVDGFGVSGVSVGQFEFDIYDEFGLYSEALLDESSVVLSCEEIYFTSPEYYITHRTISKKVCHFTAYNRLCKLDHPFDISGITFVDDAVSGDGVCSAVAHQCGFDSYGCSGGGIEYISVKKDQLENVTCRRALELIAEAMCGVWTYGSGNSLYLACFGGGDYGDYAYVSKYTEIDLRGAQKITAFVMTNSDTGNEYRFETGEYGTAIEVDTPFASSELAQEVWGRLNGYIYTAWDCENAVVTLNSFSALTGLTFAREGIEGTLFATTCNYSIDSTGIYFSGGTEPQDEAVWSYDDYLDRKKLSIGKNIGNTAINSNGDIVFKNLNKGGGLNGTDNGISIYRDDN